MPSLRFRYSRQILWALAVVGALVQGSVLGASQWAVHSVMTGLPARGELKGLEQTAQATVIFDASDKPAFSIFQEQRRDVPLADISPHLIQAIVSVEDQRFYDHNGVDLVRILGASLANIRAGPAGAGRQHAHPAAGATELPHAGQDLHAQDPGSAARHPHRERVLEGSDPRALPQQDVFRRRALRRGSRGARLLRQARPRPHRGRSRADRRPGEVAVDHGADGEPRARRGPPQRRAAHDARQRR